MAIVPVIFITTHSCYPFQINMDYALEELFSGIILNIFERHDILPLDVLYLHDEVFHYRRNPRQWYQLSDRSLGALVAEMEGDNDPDAYIRGCEMLSIAPYRDSRLPAWLEEVLCENGLHTYSSPPSPAYTPSPPPLATYSPTSPSYTPPSPVNSPSAPACGLPV